MSKTTRMILAIIAIVFMSLFTIMTVVSLYDSSLIGGSILYIALACGVVAIAIYLLIMRDNRVKNDYELYAAAETENAKDTLENSAINKISDQSQKTDGK